MNRTPPSLRDSDLVFLAIRRMERVAEKMQKFEYDDELKRHIADADEWLQYLQWIIESREGDTND